MVKTDLTKKTLIAALFVLSNFACANSSQADVSVNLKPENTMTKPDLKVRETSVKAEAVKEIKTDKTVATKDMPQQMLDLMVNYGGTTKFAWTEKDLNHDGAAEILITQIEEDISGRKVSINAGNRNMWIFARNKDKFSILNPLTHPIAPDPEEAVPIVSYNLRSCRAKEATTIFTPSGADFSETRKQATN